MMPDMGDYGKADSSKDWQRFSRRYKKDCEEAANKSEVDNRDKNELREPEYNQTRTPGGV